MRQALVVVLAQAAENNTFASRNSLSAIQEAGATVSRRRQALGRSWGTWSGSRPSLRTCSRAQA